MNNKNNDLDIINALKFGNIPSSNILDICVGRENELELFDELLNNIKTGTSEFKFIQGDYGSGKTFLLKVIEEKSFKNNFIVSDITLGNQVRLNKIENLYKSIVNNIKCKTGIGLKNIVDRWISKIETRNKAFTNGEDELTDKINEEVSIVLEETRIYSNAFALAIENYVKLKRENNNTVANNAMAWLTGQSNISAKDKREFGVIGDVKKEYALNFLKALASFIKKLDYNGLVILLDEGETTITLHTPHRNTAYNNLRDILDFCSKGEFNSTLFVLTTTEELFEDRKRGIKTYVALYDRIKSYSNNEFKNIRKPIIAIEGFSKQELITLGNEIVEIHERAYNWNSTNLINLDAIVEKNEEMAKLTADKALSRTFVRELIQYLDDVQQNPKYHNEILKSYIDDEIEDEDPFEDF